MPISRIFCTVLIGINLNSCQFIDKPLFTLLDAKQTGITFDNTITETNTRNVFNYEYLYNGGGVALGDVNGDNLIDIYFTGNQVENKLYLNKGHDKKQAFQFEDVSQISKVTGEGKWSTGVTLIDINNDNRLDIYISASVNKEASLLANIMYVNQGNNSDGIPLFKDKAAEYGIADTSHTNNAAFFDYDNDGDLDMYLLINEMENIRFPNKYIEKTLDGSSKRTDKLFENDGTNNKPHFTDISKKAGILVEGYGLGLNIADINRDGWKDIYVSNDYLSDDILYINNQNGTFTDKASLYFKHTSMSAMGNDITDLNNDGLVDILTLDMMPESNFRKKTMTSATNYSTYQNNEKYHYNYQYPRNTLQLNQGSANDEKQPLFSEIGLMAGIAETDWSWCPMATDFDNDGFRDIIITNGFPKDINDQDYMIYRHDLALKKKATLEQLLSGMPSIKVGNYAYKNSGGSFPRFENVSNKWGIDMPSFSNGSAYADLDNDGDLDFVVNNINDVAFVYRNNAIEINPNDSHFLRIKCIGLANNLNGLGAIIDLSYHGGERQIIENSPYRGYLSTVENVAHFGLGRTTLVDKITVTWPSGKISVLQDVEVNQTLQIHENAAIEKPVSLAENSGKSVFQDVLPENGIDFVHQEADFVDYYIQKLLPHKFSQFGPAIAVGDINGDKLEDVFIGGSTNHNGVFFLQKADGKFTKKEGFTDGSDNPKLSEDAGVILFDADNDQDLDLLIVSGSIEMPLGSESYKCRFYQNDGKGNFTYNIHALPSIVASGSCIKATDFDQDGDLDLFVGTRLEVNNYPKPTSSFILKNESQNGNPKFSNITSQFAPELEKIGMISDAIWTDIDNDGWQDLILAGELMPITILKNVGGKRMMKLNCPDLNKNFGFWNSLSSGDFDNDGDMDYVAGNVGINTIYGVSEEFPYKIYAKDFNFDGLYDAIPTVYFPFKNNQRKEVPYNVKDDLVKQISAFRERFTTYTAFANADIYSVFSKSDIKEALILKVTNAKSCYIENLGKGEFKMTALPLEVQSAPIFGMLTEDFNGDGNLDILMVGNDFGNEIFIGRLDAFQGALLFGNGKGGFKLETLPKSGFVVSGDGKGLVRIQTSTGKNLILATQNRGALRVFNLDEKSMAVKPNDVYGTVIYRNGKKRKVEFQYGSSFFSQSSRSMLTENLKKIEITNNKSEKRQHEFK